MAPQQLATIARTIITRSTYRQKPQMQARLTRKAQGSHLISSSLCSYTLSTTRCSQMKPLQYFPKSQVMTSYKTLCFTLRKSRKDLKSCLSIISRLKARSTKRLRKNAAAHQTEVSESTIILRSRTKHKLLRALSSQAVFMEVMITSSISRCSP